MATSAAAKQRIEIQKRVRSACTTFRALRAEWAEARVETKDAMTAFANASIEHDTAASGISLPKAVLFENDVGEENLLRRALESKRADALKTARGVLESCREHVADIRADFEKLAAAERYFSSSIREYPDDGEIMKTLTFKRFRDVFGKAAETYAIDLRAKERLLARLLAPDADDAENRDREASLAIISAWILDPLLDVERVDEFDALVLRAELQQS